MKLQELINIHLKNAILTSETSTKNLLRVLIGEMNRIGKELTDEQVVSIVKKMIENAKMLNNTEEVEILSQYLPIQMTEEQLSNIISALIFENNYTKSDLGKIMAELKKSYTSKYNAKMASEICKNMLK